MKTIRIGSGAGYAADRWEPALELIEKADLDYIAFECLAERTIAMGQLEKLRDPDRGYNPYLEDRWRMVLGPANARGVKIIIAGAGGAAHLPGMVAALSPLPVIGVPIQTKTLQGIDSLYSIVQMPAGIPVATVAIGNATNAGLLAIQILATHDEELLTQIQAYRQSLQEMVLAKQAKLERVGYSNYGSSVD